MSNFITDIERRPQFHLHNRRTVRMSDKTFKEISTDIKIVNSDTMPITGLIVIIDEAIPYGSFKVE